MDLALLGPEREFGAGNLHDHTPQPSGAQSRKLVPHSAGFDPDCRVRFGQSSKISKDLASLPASVTADVVVQYYSTPTSLDVNAAKSVGGSSGKHLGLIRSYKWTVSQGSVQSLIAKDPNIKYVSAGLCTGIDPDRPT